MIGYVERGGNLLLLGEKCARLFEPALGVSLAAPPQNITAELATSSGPVSVNGIWQDITLSSARPVGYRHLTRDVRKYSEIAATLTDCGKGKIGAVYGPLAGIFFKSHHPYLRKFIGDIVKELFPEPAVLVDGPALVDVALRTTKSGRLSLHLLNRSNLPLPDRNNFTDFIPAVGPLTVKIKTAKKPQKVTLAPKVRSLQWDWKNGMLSAVIPQVHIHSIMVVE